MSEEREQLIVAVDSQKTEAMNSCPEKYRLRFIESKVPTKGAFALERGSIVHMMLAHYYREKMTGRDRPIDMPALIEECVMFGRIAAGNSPNIDSETLDSIVRIFKEYYLKWQYDGWEVLAVESPFSKTLYESPLLRIDYEGIIDLLIVDPKMGKCVVDTKTESQRSDPVALNNQFIGYEWASGGLPIIVNKVGFQKTPRMGDDPDDPYSMNKVDLRLRRLTYRSGEHVIKEWREDTIEQVIEAIGWHKRLTQGKRLRKNRSHCDKWGGCEYLSVCKESGEVREHKLAVDFYRGEPWNPFKMAVQEIENLAEGSRENREEDRAHP